jgi:hypothetical protein
VVANVLKVPCSFKMLRTTHPTTQCHIPDNTSPQKNMLWTPQVSHDPPWCGTLEHIRQSYFKNDHVLHSFVITLTVACLLACLVILFNLPVSRFTRGISMQICP